jgi:hypothetical protein
MPKATAPGAVSFSEWRNASSVAQPPSGLSRSGSTGTTSPDSRM